MKREAFEKLAVEGFERLPQWVREKIKNAALIVEDEPSQEVCEREELEEDETLLGYYQGVPLSERGDHYGVGSAVPDTITLYQIPIEEAAEEDSMDVRDVIADTIWHEYAHHFGMDEYEVRNKEHKRMRGNDFHSKP